VIVDDKLDHTTEFSSPQSFQVTLPTTTCTNCTLQVIEFMSDHGLNDPGGCFYHHCAQVNLVAPGTPIADAGVGGGSGSDSGSGSSGSPASGGGGGCDAGAAGGLGVLGLALGAVMVAIGRRRRA
jgi:hypothetical protein